MRGNLFNSVINKMFLFIVVFTLTRLTGSLGKSSIDTTTFLSARMVQISKSCITFCAHYTLKGFFLNVVI